MSEFLKPQFVSHRYEITGTRPLLTHSPQSMQGATSKKGVKLPTNIPTPDIEAEQGAYRNDDDICCLPDMAFRASLLEGLKGSRIGKVGAATVFQAAVFPSNPGSLVPLHDPESKDPINKYEVHTCRAVIQRQGILRSRPIFRKWGCYLDLDIDESRLTPELVENHLCTAGIVVGVGDFRIAKKGIFGAFDAKHLGPVADLEAT